MKHVLIISAVVALSYAQSLQSEPPSSVIGVPGPRWRGPFADHVPGQLVSDTPPVAEAKLAHSRAHAQILAIIPTLSPEERYISSETPQQSIPNNLQSQQPQYQNVQPQYQNVQPQYQNVQPQQKSELGETPEVYAARIAHMKARMEISKHLPKLVTEDQSRVVDHQFDVQQKWYYTPEQPTNVGILPTDTPEVAAAKEEHLRIHAAAAAQG